jgi:hypothetical protein
MRSSFFASGSIHDPESLSAGEARSEIGVTLDGADAPGITASLVPPQPAIVSVPARNT